ncbi:Tim44/TimA family putative adaptor protein [Rickettsiales endosymbiont of Stachyamoeba lipophora]|uniref:Tim44/TimA family putative adaptor protein n=1 Tax=Rickettsiales endosymbiont of Stachyamoeba lipophora TaxID=2486578 RepID=UPI000F6554C6|nr:Tim44/TimA family putative adaptor protein [Rickettsiales endosymbiont of Stachyamoeba lipophora]AZL15428.1 hypothetical protein EF513_02525 [Rickettsiales endosymbiont of Stachyamoeba lipophora]
MDLLFFAIIALFIAYKYYSMLGKRDGDDDLEIKKEEIKKRLHEELRFLDLNSSYENEENIVSREPIIISTDPTIVEIITKINETHPNFTEKFFLNGAKNVFEIIIKEYTTQNINGLKHWVNEEILNHFNKIIEHQKHKKQQLKVTMIKLDAEIVKGELQNNSARLTVKFASEQIILLYDDQNNIIQGNVKKPEKIEDIWVFEKKLKSPDQKWTLVKIENL